MGLFSHMVMYVDTCTRSLPAPEPYRSSPKGGFLMSPQPKAFPDGLNDQLPLPMHVYFSLLTLTLALLVFGFPISLSSH